MSRTIWKYTLAIADDVELCMPEGARILTVAEQHGLPWLWAMVDPAAPKVARRLAIRGTGHPLGDVGDYIGTFMLERGALVFHVFEASARP